MPEPIQVTVTELRLLNFRAFGAARLRFSDLTFLVGRNGAGKTRHPVQAVYGFELLGRPADSSYEVRECLHVHPERSSFDRRGSRFETARNPGVSPPAGNLVLPLIARSDRVWEAVFDAARSLRSYVACQSASGGWRRPSYDKLVRELERLTTEARKTRP
jgi:hypothetical protein